MLLRGKREEGSSIGAAATIEMSERRVLAKKEVFMMDRCWATITGRLGCRIGSAT